MQAILSLLIPTLQSRGRIGPLRFSPDGNRLAFTVFGDRRFQWPDRVGYRIVCCGQRGLSFLNF